MSTCDQCGRERTADEPDYSPLQLLIQMPGQRVGWYSGSDGEICGDDMEKLFKIGNGL